MIVYTGKYRHWSKFYTERPFLFDGVRGTEFLWPVDRSTFFHNGDHIVEIPVFDLTDHRSPGTLEETIENNVIRYECLYPKRKKQKHITLIRVRNYPTLIGISVTKFKLRPVTNYFEHLVYKEPNETDPTTKTI